MVGDKERPGSSDPGLEVCDYRKNQKSGSIDSMPKNNVLQFTRKTLKVVENSEACMKKGVAGQIYSASVVFLTWLVKSIVACASGRAASREREKGVRITKENMSRTQSFSRLRTLALKEIEALSWATWKRLKRMGKLRDAFIVFDKTNFVLPRSYLHANWHWKKIHDKCGYYYGVEVVFVCLVFDGCVWPIAFEHVLEGEGEIDAAKRILNRLERLVKRSHYRLCPIVCDRGYVDSEFLLRASRISVGVVTKPKRNMNIVEDGRGLLQEAWALKTSEARRRHEYYRDRIEWQGKRKARQYDLWEVPGMEGWEELRKARVKVRLIVATRVFYKEFFIAIGSPLNITTRKVFEFYRRRWAIEEFFDLIKNHEGSYLMSYDITGLLNSLFIHALGCAIQKLYMVFRRAKKDIPINDLVILYRYEVSLGARVYFRRQVPAEIV